MLTLLSVAAAAVVLLAWWADARARRAAWRHIARTRRDASAGAAAHDDGWTGHCPRCDPVPRHLDDRSGADTAPFPVP